MLLTAAIIAIPVLIIVASLLQNYSPVWEHLLDTVLRDYVLNSLLLMLGVGSGTLVLGVSAAWLTAMCEFPGRRVFNWALLLPMAMPAYIIAYTYTGMLDFSGPIQSALRSHFDWGFGDYYFPEIRSLGGAICMLSLVLYPYVYLLVRVAFSEQSTAVLEASRSLGKGPWKTLFLVALPMARPAIAAGVSLALMEALADFGTVDYFGVSTFTTGIFRTWYGLGELRAAAQLAAFLLLFVFILFVLEQYSRRRMRFHHNSVQQKPTRIMLKGWRAGCAFLLALTIVTAGFLLPALQLASWASERLASTDVSGFMTLVTSSFTLAAIASTCCLVLALILAYGKRLHPGPLERQAARVSSMGYAVPGTVIAVGVLIPFAWMDNRVDALMREHFNISTGLVLSGTLAALVFAYVVRFLSVSLQTVDSGLARIRPSIDESARSLGKGPLQVLQHIHLPMLRGSVATALLLVFVDVLKELPTTLILRPFNFNTLAVRAYELASDERLADAALPALAIVLIGLLPVTLMTRTSSATAAIHPRAKQLNKDHHE
ncbi:iron ABC transporter permease [Parahaliea sp. F7430]|uniref:Iron ABC transporter permease n=1 Tax=Sediminihaliea albiluteola TaxID=2758564 RepID=A0A7W2TU29_9GAMM|nr:iron ABC transporter permease [Sediminihaliea albiluteola]MBA6411938.1 iron ABC transporter permease [Sediminihaliea albiluteola]